MGSEMCIRDRPYSIINIFHPWSHRPYSDRAFHAYVQVESFNSADDEDWRRGWSDAVVKNPTTCPACGGALKAIGLTPEERARIRDTLFGLAGLQVKKHARSRRVQRAFCIPQYRSNAENTRQIMQMLRLPRVDIIGQLREFESPRVYCRINSWGLFLCIN